MRALHDSRQAIYRSPFGAVPVGTEVAVSIDVWDDPGVSCLCRTWVDGKGETLLPMEREDLYDSLSCRKLLKLWIITVYHSCLR